MIRSVILGISNPMDEITKLRRELQLCKEECDRLRALQPFRRGLEGERYVAELLGAKATATNARHDIFTKSGHSLEVKLGKLRVPVDGAVTKQWAWRYILGEDGKKKYDRLILLGPVDERFRKPTDGPYVIFDIPYNEVIELPNPNYLAVTTNQNRGYSRVSAILYSYLTTDADLQRNY